MFYFTTSKLQSIFWQNTSCIRKPQVISGGGGVLTPCTLPLDLPLHAMHLTELVCAIIATMDSEIPSITSQQGMRIQYLKKKNETVFENLSIYKYDWQLNERMCQSPVEVSILPHFFSRCDRPLLSTKTDYSFSIPETSLTQRFPNSNSFLSAHVKLKVAMLKTSALSSH